MSLSNIIAVIDPTRAEQPAMERALFSARETGATLHLLTVIFQAHDHGQSNPEIAKQALINEYERQMQAAREMPMADGVNMEIEVVWHEEPAKAVAQAVSRLKADMVFKDVDGHKSNLFSKSDDVYLLRTCSCPVMLVRANSDWSKRRTVAAINLLSEDADHQRLNNNVISLARRFADSHQTEVHFVNAYSDSLHYPDRSELAHQCGVPGEQIHVKAGHPSEVIVETANELDADLVLIGTVARTGMKGLVLGNTAEKVLDRVNCDILTIN